MVRPGFQTVDGIAHSKGQPRGRKHENVVFAVSDARDLRLWDAKMPGKHTEGPTLVGLFGEYLDVLGAEGRGQVISRQELPCPLLEPGRNSHLEFN